MAVALGASLQSPGLLPHACQQLHPMSSFRVVQGLKAWILTSASLSISHLALKDSASLIYILGIISVNSRAGTALSIFLLYSFV